MKKRRLSIVILVSLFLGTVFFAFYYFNGSLILRLVSQSKGEEIIRIQSPDSLVDVVLLQKNVGATVPFSYDLYIVPSGEREYKRQEALMKADHMSDIKIIWRQQKFLEIQYSKGRIYHFSNFWQSKDVQNFSYVVELRLTPQTDTWSLSKEDRWISEP